MKKILHIQFLFVLTFAFAGLTVSLNESTAQKKELVVPVKGSFVLAGNGKTPDCVLDTFLHLCRSATPKVVVICLNDEPKISVERWKKRGAKSVHVIKKKPESAEQMVRTLITADGIWIENSAGTLQKDSVFSALIVNVAARGRVIGGAAKGAFEIVGKQTKEKNKNANASGLGLLPNSQLHFSRSEKRNGSPGDGLIHWQIPDSTALAIHHGRRVCAFGNGKVVARIAGNQGWPERKVTVQAIDVFENGDIPSYSFDLLSWRRAAKDRTSPQFPGKTALKPQLKSGTMILQGGSGVNETTFKRFIAAAGGKDAPIVCIPSAADFSGGRELRSYSANQLRELGCSNVTILHTADPHVADQNERFLSPLRKAKGIWIDGGRTYRVMDAFENTRAQQLMKEVLNRGGVVGGSSAGCQVVGDLLVRGDPRTNRKMIFEGYTRGLRLIEGIVVDAHFLQRGRGKPFEALVKRYPQMLGIGIDEKTAIEIRGSRCEVLGSNAVSFYDVQTNDSKKSTTKVILKRGEAYNLVERKRIR